jgi:hypothetical protein
MVAAIVNIVFGNKNLCVIAFISTTAKSADQREELCPHFPIKQNIACLVGLFGEAFKGWRIEF